MAGAIGAGEGDDAVGGDAQHPAAFVDQVMVAAAEGKQVVQVVGPASSHQCTWWISQRSKVTSQFG